MARKKTKLTPEQERSARIFRLRGFFANARTLPFTQPELVKILAVVDSALLREGTHTQTVHMNLKRP